MLTPFRNLAENGEVAVFVATTRLNHASPGNGFLETRIASIVIEVTGGWSTVPSR